METVRPTKSKQGNTINPNNHPGRQTNRKRRMNRRQIDRKTGGQIDGSQIDRQTDRQTERQKPGRRMERQMGWTDSPEQCQLTWASMWPIPASSRMGWIWLSRKWVWSRIHADTCVKYHSGCRGGVWAQSYSSPLTAIYEREREYTILPF